MSRVTRNPSPQDLLLAEAERPGDARPTRTRAALNRVGTTALTPRTLSMAVSFALTLISPAIAEEWTFVGARYQGMGGAGVALVDDEHAAYWNPGALAFTQSYGAAIPVGLQAAAEGDVLASVDNVADFIDRVSDDAFAQILIDLEAGNQLTPEQAGNAVALISGLLPGLDQPGQGLIGSAHAALMLRYERASLSGLGIANFAADPIFDRTNLSLSNVSGAAAIDGLVDAGAAMDRYAPGQEPALVGQLQTIFTTAGSANPNLQAEELVFQVAQSGADIRDPAVAQAVVEIANATANAGGGRFVDNASGAFVRGLAVQEVGVAYGHPLPFWKKRIGVGGHLKYMHGTTFNKFVRYDEIEGGSDLATDATGRNQRKTTHTASLDLGLMVRPYDWLRFGLTARNITRPQFDLAIDPRSPVGKKKLALDPQVRVGAALWVLPNWAIALDIDLTENESELLDGFSSRIISLGTEWKIPVGKLGVALRAGATMNTAAEDPSSIALTGGLGLRLFDLNLDVAVGASPRTEKLEAANDQEFPSRVNASVMLSFRRAF